MKNLLRLMALLATMGMSAAAYADTVIINDGFYGQGQTLTIVEGAETGPARIVGRAAIFGQRFDIFFTEGSSNIISDHLFSRGGGNFPGESDDIFFSSDGMDDPLLGTVCGPNQACIAETGLLQDVSQDVINIIGTNNWCGGGGNCSISVQSDAADLPEPSSLALIGLALAALGFSRRRRA